MFKTVLVSEIVQSYISNLKYLFHNLTPNVCCKRAKFIAQKRYQISQFSTEIHSFLHSNSPPRPRPKLLCLHFSCRPINGPKDICDYCQKLFFIVVFLYIITSRTDSFAKKKKKKKRFLDLEKKLLRG